MKLVDEVPVTKYVQQKNILWIVAILDHNHIKACMY